jgi:L-amino acid N-acyltransferase YncA/predicted ester cyclase
MTTEEKNKEVIISLVQATDRGDFSLVTKCYHEDFIEHNPHSVIQSSTGRRGVEEAFRTLHNLFPTRKHVVEDIIAEGDKVAARITLIARLPEDMLCPPMHNKEYRVTGTTIYRLKEFQIIEKWTQVSVSKELGVPDDLKNLFTMQIRAMAPGDYSAIAKIYNEGIETKNATFEQQAPSEWNEFSSKFLDIAKIVAVRKDEIVGWAALSGVSSRCVYAGVCEVSIYVHQDHRGKHIGKSLLQYLINLSEKNNIWTLQAGIFPENQASAKIHTDLGFRIVGYREKIGKMHGVWRDTLLLERRSNLIN